MPSLLPGERILAIDPTTRGFAFAVLELPNQLIAWQARVSTRGGHDLLQRVAGLIAYHAPAVLALEDVAAPGLRRRQRARREIHAMEALATERGLEVERVSRLAVLDTLAPGKTKYDVALAIAERFPVLAKRLPRKRKTWMTEDERMNIFDALAFAVVARERGSRQAK